MKPAVVAVASLALTTAACLEYSPHETASSDRAIHAANLGTLLSREVAGPLRFAVVGDTQLSFDEAADAVEHLNGVEGLAFVVQVGDFTDLGRLQEFAIMTEIFERLRVPWFVVIGNHDLLGNGGDIYASYFGARNQAFTYDRTRFVFLDTNSREAGFSGGVPDLVWLDAELAPGSDHDRAVVFSHVWPWSTDFDAALHEPFRAALRDAGVLWSFHGHDHNFRQREDAGVRYVIADAVDRRTLLVATGTPSGDFAMERVSF